MKGFDTTKMGRVKAYLLDCDPSGTDCVNIASAARTKHPWSNEPGWVAGSVEFGTVDYTVAADRALAVQLVVTSNADDDMWFAYDTVSYPSALNVHLASTPPSPPTTTTTTPAPAPTTTTTTTITTTTSPPPAPAPTATTTIAPAVATTTTTTTIAPAVATTTTSPVSTTTTTTVVASGAAPPTSIPPEIPLPEEDASLSPLPGTERQESQAGLSRGLLESLELAIPPAVASSLLSPLLLVRSILGAFVATGRGLLIPGILLTIAFLLVGGRRRRQQSLLETDALGTQA
ncbi:MAG: hypothetical protein GY788_22510 [bacterium]|nr:hypothetical protein [bacterium]